MVINDCYDEKAKNLIEDTIGWSGLFFLRYEKACLLGKIKIVHSIWMYGRVGRQKYKAGVKPREITTGLLDHIKKWTLS